MYVCMYVGMDGMGWDGRCGMVVGIGYSRVEVRYYPANLWDYIKTS